MTDSTRMVTPDEAAAIVNEFAEYEAQGALRPESWSTHVLRLARSLGTLYRVAEGRVVAPTDDEVKAHDGWWLVAEGDDLWLLRNGEDKHGRSVCMIDGGGTMTWSAVRSRFTTARWVPCRGGRPCEWPTTETR